ncbi:hypothetical protein ARMGADRAFT_1028569 [Armillaria gallica]|uniref:Putative collagen-binding domain-containing protein n=1 Tax=Armillaria gallica TaxID=47427 RepID=A0A2H3E3P2_ARMGA|nr:hypothetical protein ARMGADRAFT_1028569 [Armillaria gallica]
MDFVSRLCDCPMWCEQEIPLSIPEAINASVAKDLHAMIWQSLRIPHNSIHGHHAFPARYHLCEAQNPDILARMVQSHKWITGGWQNWPAPHAVNTTNVAVFDGFIGKRYVGIPEIMGGDTNAFWPPRHDISAAEEGKGNQTHMNITDYRTIFNALAYSVYDTEKALLPKDQGYPLLGSGMKPSTRWMRRRLVMRSSREQTGRGLVTSRARKRMKTEVEFEFHQECPVGIGIMYGEYSVYHFPNPALSPKDSDAGETWFEGLACRPRSSQVVHIRILIKDLARKHDYFGRIPDQNVLTTDEDMLYRRVSTTRDMDGMWIAVYAPTGEAFGADMSVLVADRRCDRELVEITPDLTVIPPTNGGIEMDWMWLVDVS